MQSVIASFMRLFRTSRDFAWVWHPGTEKWNGIRVLKGYTSMRSLPIQAVNFTETGYQFDVYCGFSRALTGYPQGYMNGQL